MPLNISNQPTVDEYLTVFDLKGKRGVPEQFPATFNQFSKEGVVDIEISTSENASLSATSLVHSKTRVN